MRRSIVGVAIALGTFVRGGELEAKAGDVISALDDDGGRVELRIDSVEIDPKDPAGELHLYAVSVRTGGGFVPYCQADIEGRRAAIPVAGSWSPVTGRLVTSKDTLTFACTSGAIGKCMRFGYKPWKTVNGHSLEPLHAACVRMVRADYCGDGRPHTVNGTLIDVFDDLGIQREDVIAGRTQRLEAGWSPSGATFLSIPRQSDDVRAIVAECPEHFRGRTSLDRPLDAEGVRAAFPETILFDNRTRQSAN